MKFKMTPMEKKWVLYDVGNSAFTMLVSTIFPIYFNYLAGNAGISDADYLAYWGYAASVSTLCVALLGPTLGAIADTKNFKKRIFKWTLAVGVLGCVILGFLSSWIWFLGIFVLAKVGYSSSLVFYDAMLTDVTEPERMDTVSFSGICLGIYRKLYSIYCQPWHSAWRRQSWTEHAGVHDDRISDHCGLVARIGSSIASVFPAETLCGSVRGYVVRESFARLGRTFLGYKERKAHFCVPACIFLLISTVCIRSLIWRPLTDRRSVWTVRGFFWRFC